MNHDHHRRRARRRPCAFDIALGALVVALVCTAAVMVTDLMCRGYAGQSNGCDWPWVAADSGARRDAP